jgi:hypothetical protein
MISIETENIQDKLYKIINNFTEEDLQKLKEIANIININYEYLENKVMNHIVNILEETINQIFEDNQNLSLVIVNNIIKDFTIFYQSIDNLYKKQLQKVIVIYLEKICKEIN